MLNIVLFEPEIPYNAGNIGRTCVALQAKLWLVRPLGFQIDDKHLRRAGLDYWELLNWEVVENWEALLERMPDANPWFFTKHAKKLYTQAKFSPDDVLVFGSESRGLPPAIITKYQQRCLRIPMHENVRCLNMAVSAGIAMYEVVRQTGYNNLT
jgi:tRNA (cytidine/uridine-2'-O-)-methyltransferase